MALQLLGELLDRDLEKVQPDRSAREEPTDTEEDNDSEDRHPPTDYQTTTTMATPPVHWFLSMLVWHRLMRSMRGNGLLPLEKRQKARVLIVAREPDTQQPTVTCQSILSHLPAEALQLLGELRDLEKKEQLDWPPGEESTDTEEDYDSEDRHAYTDYQTSTTEATPPVHWFLSMLVWHRLMRSMRGNGLLPLEKLQDTRVLMDAQEPDIPQPTVTFQSIPSRVPPPIHWFLSMLVWHRLMRSLKGNGTTEPTNPTPDKRTTGTEFFVDNLLQMRTRNNGLTEYLVSWHGIQLHPQLLEAKRVRGDVPSGLP